MTSETTDATAALNDILENAQVQQQQTAQQLEDQVTTGGARSRGSRYRSGGRGRGRKGGSFLTEISVPIALLAATQYMKNRGTRRTGKRRRRGNNYRKRASRRRRRR